MFIIDTLGKWKVEGNVKMLIEPSESYLAKRELERQRQEEEELLNSLIPTQEELNRAETDLQIINILMEVGLI